MDNTVNNDLPVMPEQTPVLPALRPDLLEWERTHAETLLLRVWVTGDGRTLIGVRWHDDIEKLSVAEKPLADMGQAVAAAFLELQKVARAIVGTEQALGMLRDVEGDN